MVTALVISSVLVTLSIFVHYEVLRLLSIAIPRFHLAVRLKVLAVVLCVFVAHTIEVWIYAFAYLAMDRLGLGALKGQVDGQFADYLYFSATSYSTLGFGDVYPIGAHRLVAGVEGVNGLFLIAWSTSFTYFVMDRLWPLHSDPADRREKP